MLLCHMSYDDGFPFPVLAACVVLCCDACVFFVSSFAHEVRDASFIVWCGNFFFVCVSRRALRLLRSPFDGWVGPHSFPFTVFIAPFHISFVCVSMNFPSLALHP